MSSLHPKPEPNADRLVKGLAFNGNVRIVAARTTGLVENARRIHDTWPTATAAFGRTLTGALLMAALADEEEEITLQIMGSGPVGRLMAISTGTGKVKGTISEPHVDLRLNKQGKLDVGGAVGLPGKMLVIKCQREKAPYHGMVPLVSGEIGEDLAEYYSRSEQIPTAVGVGVKVNPGGEVVTAGGFIIQALPGLSGEELDRLTGLLSALTGVTDELTQAGSVEDFVSRILAGEDWRKLAGSEPVYACGCHRERFEKALIALGKKEVEELLSTTGRIETVCQFCHQKYDFTREETESWFK
ncbi:MAG TPA: Hsp33 family molecular chaperone HslO [Bacillota bacterium]